MRASVGELRGFLSSIRIELRGIVRRVSIGAASATRMWQFLGYIGGEGERETFDDVEPFQGVGFSSRPKAGHGEAILANVGGKAGHPVAVATRDRASEPEDLAEDETQMHNTVTHVRVTAAGVVEVAARSGGAPVALATLADLQALVNTFNAHTHAVSTTGTAAAQTGTAAAPTPAGAPSGTAKFKAQ